MVVFVDSWPALPATRTPECKEGPDVVYHKLRTRKSASRRYVEFHLLVPGNISVDAAHDRCEAIENEIEQRFPKTRVTIHVEPRPS